MFACFALKRLDVFSTGDLGVQRGMAALVGRDVEKLKKAGKGAKGGGKWKYMSEKEMEEMAEKFSPYRWVLHGLVFVFSFGGDLHGVQPLSNCHANTSLLYFDDV